MRCAHCEHENAEGYAFCGRCGRPSENGAVRTEVLPPVEATPQEGRHHLAAENHWPPPEVSPAPPPQPPRESGQDEATRYLCAAAHLDSAFAERLVTKVLEEPFRAVVQSPALNLSAVLRHVAAARARHLARDICLVFALLMFVTGLFTSLWLLPLSLAAGWVVVLAEAYTARWGARARTLRREQFDAANAPEPAQPLLGAQIDLAEAYIGGNVTAYSGYEPFLGYGQTIGGWSMALDVTTPGRRDEPVEPFTIGELHTGLRSALAELDFPRLSVHDRLFIDGSDIHHDGRFLTGQPVRPVITVTDELLDRLRAQPEDRARPYLVTEIVGWGGELVFTAFVRVSLTSTNLFVEASYSLLPPMHSSYHEIDRLLHTPTVRQFFSLVGRSMISVFPMLLFCLPRSARQVFAGFRQARKTTRQHREMRQFGSFNHGALISIREAASELRNGSLPGYHRYFQVLDKEMYVKVVEKKIFDTLCAFLKDKNIDPDELLRRVESIINNGVMISGNAKVSGGMFGGRGAKILSKTTE